jgi:hypothetical protein
MNRLAQAAAVMAAAGQRPAGQVVLVVGEAGAGRRELQPANDLIAFVPIDMVDTALIQTMQPDIVLSPLLAGSFDCIDLAQILAEAGYGGAYRAVAPDLPSSLIIRREIRALCPTLDFDLLRAERLALN